jgi:hypothetical protein
VPARFSTVRSQAPAARDILVKRHVWTCAAPQRQVTAFVMQIDPDRVFKIQRVSVPLRVTRGKVGPVCRHSGYWPEREGRPPPEC